MAQVIMFSNQKGGVGKTTTSLEFCATLARRKKRVLAIDTDSQCDLSTYSGSTLNWDYNLLDVLTYLKNVISETEEHYEEINIKHAIQSTPEGFDIIVSTPKLANADTLFSGPQDVYLLNDLIGEISNDYDYIVIDCAPARNSILYMVYFVANYCILLSDCDEGSIRGIKRVITDVNILVKRNMSNVKIIGTLLTRDENTREHTRIYEQLVNIGIEKNVYPLRTTLLKNITASESKAYNRSINRLLETLNELKKDYNIKSNTVREIKKRALSLVENFNDITDEILERIEH